MRISVRVHVFQGHEFSVPGVRPESTVLDLKETISRQRGFVVEQQQLNLFHSADSLPDGCTLASVCHDPTLALELKLFNRVIPLRIVRPERDQSDIAIKTYPCCSVARLKEIIRKHTAIPVADQALSYNGTPMSDEKLLVDYNLKDPEDTMNLSSIEEANATTTSRPFELHLNVRRFKGKLSLGIDFSFNSIKNVKKTGWKSTAPTYREVTDGLSWICYCRNVACPIANDMFIVNRGTWCEKTWVGYGHFYLNTEIKHIVCPMCGKRLFDLRNIGFVNCQWQYRGSLINKKESKITGDGRTYDNKFYTFKEANYKTLWDNLELLAKHLDAKAFVRKVSMSSDEDEDAEKGEQPAAAESKGDGPSKGQYCVIV